MFFLCVSKNLALLQTEVSPCGFGFSNVPNVRRLSFYNERQQVCIRIFIHLQTITHVYLRSLSVNLSCSPVRSATNNTMEISLKAAHLFFSPKFTDYSF